MATYHTIERRNPFNKIKTTEFPITEYPFTRADTIQAKVVYTKSIDSDLTEEVITDLTSDDSLITIKLKDDASAYVFKINQEHEIFKNILVNSNFYVAVTDAENTDINIEVHCTIAPSSVTLENISIPTKTLSINNKSVTARGAITNSGNCELWDDYKETVLQTTLKRVYYNNTAISGADIDIIEGIKECKENGGGTVYIGKDSEAGYPYKTLTIDFSGLVLYGFKTKEYIEKINFLDCNTSTIISNCEFSKLPTSEDSSKPTQFNLINSNITFIDCSFESPEFTLDDRSSVTFINCEFLEGIEINNPVNSDSNISKVNFVKSNTVPSNGYSYGVIINSITDVNFYQCEIDDCSTNTITTKTLGLYTSKFGQLSGVRESGPFYASDSITVENCVFYAAAEISSDEAILTFETSNLKVSKSYFDNAKIKYENFYKDLPINVVITDTAADQLMFNISEDITYGTEKGFSYVIVSNSTFLQPIWSDKLGPRDLVKSIIRYSTIIGSEASATTEQFTSIQNCLVLATDETKDVGTTEVITGYDGIEAGSYLVYNKDYEVIKHSGLAYPYSIFNGCVKCLNYIADITGLKKLDLFNLYVDHSNMALLEYQSNDIFGNERAKDDAAKCGCEEISYKDDPDGAVIDYSYTNTSTGINGANSRITKYNPVLLSEYADLENDEEQQKKTLNIEWKIEGDAPRIHKVDPEQSTKVAGYSYGLYEIDTEDREKTITASIDYHDYILSNSISLRIAAVPTLRYEATSYTAWTNQTFKLKANIENADSDILTASVQWYLQPDAGSPTLVSSVPVSSETPDEAETNYYAELQFAKVKVENAGKYLGKIYYTPEGFENQRVIQGVDSDDVQDLIVIAVKYNIIINQDKVSGGEVSLHVGDKLTLVSDLTQGSEPIFTWERTTNTADANSWEVIYGPVSNSIDYTIPLYHESKTPVYYRLHVYNYNIPNDPSSGIATEDYSTYPVVLIVLPRVPTGHETNKNIVLFKVPLSDINNSEINVSNNYRLFTTLDNLDANNQANEAIDSYPAIHRRTDEQLWEFDSTTGKYVPTYEKYKFPASISIDKKNSGWGVATDELQVDNNTYTGGNLYVLDLNTLNDNIPARTNKPAISENMMDAYSSLPVANERIIFSSLGKKTVAYGNYIAVGDPDASIVISKEFSEFDVYTTDKEIFQEDGSITWEFILPNEYYGIPIFQLLDSEDKIVKSEITFVHDTNTVIVKFDWSEPSLPSGTFKLLVAGRKQIELKENIVIHEEKICPDLEVEADGYARWAFKISNSYLMQPIIQVVDKNGTVVHPLIQYSATLKRFTISIKRDSNKDISEGEYTAVLFGRNKATVEDTDVIAELHSSPILVPEADKGYLATWQIEFAKQFKTPPIIQFQVGSYGIKTVDVTSIQIDKSYKSATITIRYNEILPSSAFYALVIGRDKYGHLDEDDVIKPSYGRVLLFKYNGSAKNLKLVKVVKSPHEIQYGRFGEAIEFDEYGHLLVSAPGEKYETAIGYTEKDLNIYPVYTSEKNIKFSSLGRVYVFSIEDLVNSEVHNIVQAKQILTCKYLYNTISYQNGTWGELEGYITSNALYTIKDIATGGTKINEAFSTISSYQDYYDFCYKYDFTYRMLYPTPYSDNDFKTGNSGNDKVAIEYTKVYSTNDTEERYGTSMSYSGGNLLIGAPYFNNSIGLVEIWNYSKTDGKYVYSTSLKNPQNNVSGLFGLFLEMGSNYFLSTYRTTPTRQSVGIYYYKNGKITDNELELSGRNKELSFGEAMDSIAETFVIAAPKEGCIYRYHINTSLEDEKPISVIQELNLSKFGISKANSSISISDDKILVTYNSYGPKCEKYVNKEIVNKKTGEEKEVGLVNFGAGAVVQFTLVGGNYTIT